MMRKCPQCNRRLPQDATLCLKCGAQILPEPDVPEVAAGEPGEIDLHGYTVAEALEVFIRFYNHELQTGTSDRIKVIHGYGKSGSGGAIRAALRHLLETNPDKLTFIPGEKYDGNRGYTLVYPRHGSGRISAEQLGLDVGDQLAREILDFCAQVKTEDKITGKFRRYGAPEIKKALRSLEGQGQLRVVWKGKHKAYEAVG